LEEEERGKKDRFLFLGRRYLFSKRHTEKKRREKEDI
jgi:hypothetical protein